MIHKAGQRGWFSFEVSAATTYPATLIILGPKASTCFRRVFIVFPVPTMACEGKDRQTGLREQKIQMERKKLLTLYLYYITDCEHSLKITWLKKGFEKPTRDVSHIYASGHLHEEEVKVVVERSRRSMLCHPVGQHALRREWIALTHSH